MSKLDLLLEAEKRGILPPDKAPLLEEARRRGLVPGGESIPQTDETRRQIRDETYKAKIDREAEKRNEAHPMGYSDIAANSATFGVAPYVVGGAKGLTNYLVGKYKGEDPSLSEEYGRERDIYHRQLERTKEEVGHPLAAEIAGGLAFGVPTERAAALVSQAPRAGSTVKNFLTSTYDLAKAGALWGGAYGALEKPGTGFSEKLDNAADHAATGLVLGPAIGHGLNATLKSIAGAKNFTTDRIARNRATRAQEVADDLAAAGVRDVPLAGAPPMQQGVGDAVGSSVFGRRIRDQAQGGLQDLDAAIQREIAASGGRENPAVAGNRIRDFVREQMLEPGRPSQVVKDMPEQELQRITGFPSANPPMSTDFPPQPNRIQPVSREKYIQEVMDAVPPVQPRQVEGVGQRYVPPTAEEVQLPEHMLKRTQKMEEEYEGLRRQVKAMRDMIEEQNSAHLEALQPHGVSAINPIHADGKSYFEVNPRIIATDDGGRIPRSDFILDAYGKIHQKFPWSPDVTPAMEEQFKRTVQDWLAHSGGHADKLTNLEFELARKRMEKRALDTEVRSFRADELPKLTERRMAEARIHAQREAQAEAAIETQRRREAARDTAVPDAVAAAERRTQEMQAIENQRAEQVAAQQHRDALDAHQAQAAAPFDLAGTPETMKTQLDAAYEMTRRAIPRGRQAQVNPLGRRATDAEPAVQTPLTGTMEDIATEARARGRLQGWRGRVFDEEGRVDPALMNYLQEALPPEIAERLSILSERRASNGFAPGLESLYDFRQQLREFAEKQYHGAPGETRTYDTALLTRLRDGVNRTITETAENLGPKGRAFIAMRDKTDRAYAYYMNEYRRPLARIFDEGADSAGIYNRVRDGMRNGTNNFDTLRRLYELADAKGNNTLNRSSLTGMLLTDMAQGGPQAFLRAYRDLSPDARALMFSGPNEQMGQRLDALARAGGHLERWIEPAAHGSPNVREATRIGNIMMGVLGYFNLPTAVATAFGNAAAARMMTSQWYGRWLRAMPLDKGPASREWQQHMDRFAGYAAQFVDQDAEYGKKATNVFREMIGIKPAGAIFLGENSKTADLNSLKKAQEKLTAGEDPGKVWSDTGWYQGKDKRFRYELNDKSSAIVGEGAIAFKNAKRGRSSAALSLDKILSHEDLYTAYPELRGIKVRILIGSDLTKETERTGVGHDWSAFWDEENNQIVVNPKEVDDLNDLRSVLLHEASHATGTMAGFDYGPERGVYARRYGEVEARNVQKRMNMTPVERKASYPPQTQDVAWPHILTTRTRTGRE